MSVTSFIKKVFVKEDKGTSDSNELSIHPIKDILILPSDDKTFLTQNIRNIIHATLIKYDVQRHIQGYKYYFIRVSDQVTDKMTIVEGHGIWNEFDYMKTKIVPYLPSQQENHICPKGILRVRCECINKYTPNMGSLWGFKGYVLSLLINCSDQTIWDARGEDAA